jgi:outer membrane protein assembly factor BamE
MTKFLSFFTFTLSCTMRNFLNLIACSLFSGLLTGCATMLDHLPGVYALDIQQGNIIEQSMIDQLHPGMNTRQVLYILGSPMLIDQFHPNRWDYIYYNKVNHEDKVQKRVTLFFDKDQLVKLEGAYKPTEHPIAVTSNETTVDVPKRDLDKTLYEKLSGLFGYAQDREHSEPANLKPTSPSDN